MFVALEARIRFAGFVISSIVVSSASECRPWRSVDQAGPHMAPPGPKNRVTVGFAYAVVGIVVSCSSMNTFHLRPRFAPSSVLHSIISWSKTVQWS